jgi:Family of unknown function (DUF6283)
MCGLSMPEPSQPQAVCNDCPWRTDSKRGVWPVERFHDLRISLLPTTSNGLGCPQDAALACHGLLEFRNAQKIQTYLARMHSEFGPYFALPSKLFPSFEAMADANGAGLFDWTTQLQQGDQVLYFKYGLPKMLLEVARVHNGRVETCSDLGVYRFNALGFEMQTVIDSRILPATDATLKRFRERLQERLPNHLF